ncbi:membrane ATPase of the MinC-MinD-MinE system [Desulfosarcina cetonica]|uniref:septum site-determining protein MinD n=1 Tax=Desulfosarcina cetonica TaxID=90730 RepID=UPI0006D23A74|nr:septum site-determining protein MinD [Desulfosarcina cetonica]VTR69666.1 membrane ATPase of the MinC-MinD-MinE system [Desulfosarcina cetonica]
MQGKIIVISSGKGGVGKTTATASIGAALALEGKKVAVVDMDIGLRNLDVVMGLENRIVFNIVDVVRSKCKLTQAAIKSRRIENLFLIPASQSDNKDVMSPQDMIRVSKKMRTEFDFILMDCPAGIERGFENAVAAADEAVVVCTPEVSSVRDADRVIGLLYAKEIPSKLLINRIVPAMVERGDMLSHQDVVDVLSIDLVGLVEADDQVVVATNSGLPLVLQNESKAGQAFKRIAMRLNGKPDLPIEIPSTSKSLWKKIGSKIGFGK